MFKVDNENTRTRYEIYSKLTLKTLELQFYFFFSFPFVPTTDNEIEKLKALKSGDRIHGSHNRFCKWIWLPHTFYI